jgi:hypothetical protein
MYDYTRANGLTFWFPRHDNPDEDWKARAGDLTKAPAAARTLAVGSCPPAQ